jgi:hypothetical protein
MPKSYEGGALNKPVFARARSLTGDENDYVFHYSGAIRLFRTRPRWLKCPVIEAFALWDNARPSAYSIAATTFAKLQKAARRERAVNSRTPGFISPLPSGARKQKVTMENP